MKKILLNSFVAFLAFVLFSSKVFAGTISTLEATSNNGSITINGTVESDVLAVAAFVYSGNNLVYMETCGANGSTYSCVLNHDFASGDYVVKVADYDGGDFKTKEVNVVKRVSSSSSSSKEEIKYDETDKETGVQIVTTSKDVPSDTVIKVETVKENTKRYNEIKDVLKVNKFLVFDISLYSPSLRKNITKLSSGEFEVTIPIGREYYGKKMYAYYIQSDKSLEEYPITMDRNGNAKFRTTHFSEYIISEKINYKVAPNTGDNILSYLIITIVSGLALVGTLKIKKHLY